MAIDMSHVLQNGQFFVDRDTSSNTTLMYVGDGVTALENLKPVGTEFALPPNDGQVYGMLNGEWVPQVLLDDGSSEPTEPTE